MSAPENWNDQLGVQDVSLAQEVIDELVGACQAMLECTGGSKYWQGETEAALKQIESALGLVSDSQQLKQACTAGAEAIRKIELLRRIATTDNESKQAFIARVNKVLSS